MMFAMMQEQHQEQLNAMRESNAEEMKTANAAMAQMAKNMQTMMATMPCMSKTEVENNTRTKELKPWDKPGYVKRDQKMCPNCKRVVYHKPERCLELETNKGKRRENWKSVL